MVSIIFRALRFALRNSRTDDPFPSISGQVFRDLIENELLGRRLAVSVKMEHYSEQHQHCAEIEHCKVRKVLYSGESSIGIEEYFKAEHYCEHGYEPP